MTLISSMYHSVLFLYTSSTECSESGVQTHWTRTETGDKIANSNVLIGQLSVWLSPFGTTTCDLRKHAAPSNNQSKHVYTRDWLFESRISVLEFFKCSLLILLNKNRKYGPPNNA